MHNNENVSGISAYLLGLIWGDGGLYKLKYKGNRSEYRVVITQKSENLIKQFIAPRMQFLIDELNVKSKIQIVKGDTRYELRVSSKKLYYYFANMLERIRLFNGNRFLAYLAGIVDGDGSIIAQIKPNQSYKFKHQLSLTFQVTQKTERRWFLDKLVDEIGVGYVRDRGSVSDYILSEIKPLHNFLTQLQPFLNFKQKQANLVLKIIEQLPSAKESPDKFLEVCTWVDQIAALNDSKTRKTTSETVRAVLDSLSEKKKSSP
uniref:chimera of homing endonuclease I-DmoI and DNA endonuclease I-CreI n=1 Tax=Chlamydomonas reinhardtii TaxID=3055 RepID=UPI000011269F|nr:Chain A, chimera of homing endonuclease I-DmoI and DNA endonuclease I-CreI [Desulfurococcus mucosus]1MOW_D Chain D, chimera of homing endonuclease I-DmoI and DNA endonuclease I-CreI [Desulfurococcus mucosus]1MOW_G Chain G, chimera of homing endonuclease I-DmoI and DNA endonuclease I-CreI [Desulfurococcus mucosus]1MOW_J Chain J, chimera of homing endonuclease I-DmoI and DNA endonuclease I-CreI [Desulfurococcus mucosus]